MVRNKWLGVLLTALLLLGFGPRANAAFAQFNFTTDSRVSIIGSPCQESIWLDPAQASFTTGSNGFYHRVDFIFNGTDVQVLTYLAASTSRYHVYIDGALTTAAPGGRLPGTLTTSLSISLVNGASVPYTTGAGFVNATGLADTAHACSIIFDATTGNTDTYWGKLFQVQGANPSISLPSHTAFPTAFPVGIGGSAPVTTSAGAIASYIGVDDTTSATSNSGTGLNMALQPQKPDGSIHFRTIGGTGISLAKWTAGVTAAAQKVLTVTVDNVTYPDIDMFATGSTGNALDILPLVSGLANVNHDVEITYSDEGSAIPSLGTLIVEGGNVDTSAYPAPDAVVAGYGDSITLTVSGRYGSSAHWLFQYKREMARRGKRIAIRNRGIAGTYVTSAAGAQSGVSRYADVTGLAGVTEVMIAYGTNDFGDFGRLYQDTGGYLTNQTQLGKFQDSGGATGFEKMLDNLTANLPTGTIFRVVGIYPRLASFANAKGSQPDSAAYFTGANMSREFIQAWNNTIQDSITHFTATHSTYLPYIKYYNPTKFGDPWLMTEVPPAAQVASASANGTTTTITSTTQIVVGKGILCTGGANAGKWTLVEAISGSGPYTMTVYPPLTVASASGDSYAYNGDTTYLDAATSVTSSANGTTTTLITSANLTVGNDLMPTSGTNNGLYVQITAKSGTGPYTYTLFPALTVATASGDTWDYNRFTKDNLHPLIRGAKSIAAHLANEVLPLKIVKKPNFPRGTRNDGRHGGRN